MVREKVRVGSEMQLNVFALESAKYGIEIRIETFDASCDREKKDPTIMLEVSSTNGPIENLLSEALDMELQHTNTVGRRCIYKYVMLQSVLLL